LQPCDCGLFFVSQTFSAARLIIGAMFDKPTSLRDGESLDVDSLRAYLETWHPELSGEIQVQQFPSGYSNLTYLLTIGDREVVLRRPPMGVKIKSAHDMGREFNILSALRPIYDKVPEPLLHCEDDSVIGTPFYLMERVRGVILRQTPPEDLELPQHVMKQISESFVDNFHQIHSLDWQATELRNLAHPEGYVERQIAGWSKRYMNAKTDEISEMDFLMLWLEENRPSESGSALIHNDYKYDNLVLDPDDLSNIRAVLDWEMATIGDPLMDLGSSLAYWVEADDPNELQALRFCLTHLPGNLTRRELIERYLSNSSHSDRNMLFYYVYGLFKLAVVAQQIYARYVAGRSSDPRFAHLNHGVEALAKTGYRAIQQNSVS